MIQQALNSMMAVMVAKFMLNDVPHAIFEKTKPLRELYAKYGMRVNDEFILYHFTRREFLEGVLTTGLAPKASPGLGGIRGRATLPGVYLAPTREIALGLLEDYDTKEDRVPGTFSLVEVRLPGGWVATEDREMFPSLEDPPCAISPSLIPPHRIRLVEENFYTVAPIGEYREFPGEMARVDDRVRIKHGEHAGEEGVITRWGEQVGRRMKWTIKLDSGEETKAMEDEIATLVR